MLKHLFLHDISPEATTWMVSAMVILAITALAWQIIIDKDDHNNHDPFLGI